MKNHKVEKETEKMNHKIKLVLNNPQKIPNYTKKVIQNLFLSKKEQATKFFINEYSGYDKDFIFSKLKHYWKEYRYFDKIMENLNIDKNTKILDVGCGYTSVLNILPKSDKYGIDIVINGLKESNLDLNKDIDWIDGRAENLPFKNNYFDIIFSTNGIDHYKNPDKAIKEINRVLKMRGKLILSLNVFNKDLGKRDKHHLHTFTEDKILEKLKNFVVLLKEESSSDAFCRYIRKENINRPEKKELILMLEKPSPS